MCKFWPVWVSPLLVLGAGSLISVCNGQNASRPAHFTRLVQLPAPSLVASTAAYPGPYEAGNLLDGERRSEYASNGKGSNTFIEVEFSQPTRLAGFRHVDRNDPATVAASELTFMDEAGNALSSLAVKHINERGGVTFFVFPSPVMARKVRWQVTELGSGLSTVGGAEIAFFTTWANEAEPRGIEIESRSLQLRERNGEVQTQPLKVLLDYPYVEPAEATIRVGDAAPKPVRLVPGSQWVDMTLPA